MGCLKIENFILILGLLTIQIPSMIVVSLKLVITWYLSTGIRAR